MNDNVIVSGDKLNPCCKFKNMSILIDEEGCSEQVTILPKAGAEKVFVNTIQNLYCAISGGGSGDLIKYAQSLTPEQRCWICRKLNIFPPGSDEYPQSLIQYASGEGDEYEYFIGFLKCSEFGFQSDSGNVEGQGYVAESPMDKVNKGTCGDTTIKTSGSKNLCDIILVETIKSYLL
jgi:hypothetical protein